MWFRILVIIRFFRESQIKHVNKFYKHHLPLVQSIGTYQSERGQVCKVFIHCTQTPDKDPRHQ